VQSGDDMILKRMKRRHTRGHTIEFCQNVRRRRPDIAFGADLIAGFPTETEQMFENTLRLVDEAELSYLHVFPFSPREGTPAARMPQLPKSVVAERASRLRSKGESALAKRLAALVGTTQLALAEGELGGRTGCFAPVRFQQKATPGVFVRARIAGSTGSALIAEIA